MAILSQNSAVDFTNKRLWEILSACPLCSSSAFRKHVDACDRHYGNPGVFPVMRCEACGVSFLNPMPTLAYLSMAYPQDYYAYTVPSASQTRSPHQKQIRRMIRQAICFTSGWTGDPKFVKPGSMLDIGCGAGSFISEMRDKGWDVHGVELDFHASACGCRQGLDIFPGTLHDAHFPAATFDYVRSNHSFEHIHNPREILREIRSIIRPNGQLFLGVPNLAGLMPKMWGTYWWYLGAPVHTFGYTPASLSRLIEEEGFQVERVNYNSTFAGIFGSLQIWANRNNDKSSDDGWIVNSQPLKLLGHWFARITDICHSGDCIEIIARPV